MNLIDFFKALWLYYINKDIIFLGLYFNNKILLSFNS